MAYLYNLNLLHLDFKSGAIFYLASCYPLLVFSNDKYLLSKSQ